MDRWLQKEATLRVLAVALAVLLWFQVAAERQRPEVQHALEDMPVSWRYLGDGLAVLDLDPATVSIVVRGERTVMDGVSRQDFDAIVNLRGADIGSTVLYVTVSVPRGVQLVEVIPDVVRVNLEQTVEVTLEPAVRVDGSPAAGYQVGDVVVSPSAVTVAGGVSIVERVYAIEGFLSIGDQSASITSQVALRAVDDEGTTLPDVMILPGDVTVAVELERLLTEKVLPVIADASGTPAPGFRVADIIVDPHQVGATIWVMAVDDVDAIFTEVVQLDGLDRTQTVEVPLVMVDGVSSLSEQVVTVEIVIERDR